MRSTRTLFREGFRARKRTIINVVSGDASACGSNSKCGQARIKKAM